MGCFQSSDADKEGVRKSGVTSGETTNLMSKDARRIGEADAEADASGQVVSVPRAIVSVGDRERAELRVKNMRDKLMSTVIRSEQVMLEEGRLALKFRREKRIESAKILIQRRQLLKNKIDRAQTQLSTVYDMIEGMEQAQDNKSLMLAIEQGTQAINDITKDVSVERMQSALSDNRQAIEYVNTLGQLLKDDAQQVDDQFDYDAAFDQLEQQIEENPTPSSAAAAAIDQIPDTPDAIPEEPYPPASLPKSQFQEPLAASSA